MASQTRVHLLISGRVQGIGFRFGVIDQARQLGLTGWVRNTPEGDVELTAEGPEDRVQRLVTWCHGGPPSALVTDVQPTWGESRNEFSGFQIRR